DSGNSLSTDIVEGYTFGELGLSGTYATKNVGTENTITFTISSSNYELTSGSYDNGEISKKELIVSYRAGLTTANFLKIYDRKPYGVMKLSEFDITGFVSGETLTENFNLILSEAGEYQLNGSILLNSASVLNNYSIKYLGKVKIQKAQIKIEVSIVPVTYNAEPREISYTTTEIDSVNINADEMSVEYYYTNGVKLDNLPINAGSYIVKFTPVTNFIILNGSEQLTVYEHIFVINKKPTGSIKLVVDQTKTYDGNVFSKTFTSSSTLDSSKVEASLCTGHILTLTASTKDFVAGTYSLSDCEYEITIKDSTNQDVKRNYNIGDLVGNIVILPKYYTLTQKLEDSYTFTYDKTVKSISTTGTLWDEVKAIDKDYTYTIKYFDANNNEVSECKNAGSYRVELQFYSSNYTFAKMFSNLIINQRQLYTNQNFDKAYDNSSDVIDEIVVYDFHTKQILAINDDVKIIGYFVNNYDNQIRISAANDNLKIQLALDGTAKDNYILADYDISAKIKKRGVTISVNATEYYTSQAAKVYATKMSADNLATGQTLSGYITFASAITVGVYENFEGLGISLSGFAILNNKLEETNNYNITVEGRLEIIPAEMEINNIADINYARVYNGAEHKVEQIEFTNISASGCFPYSEQYRISYLDASYNEVSPINAGSYYVKVEFVSNNYTFKNGEEKVSSYIYPTTMVISKRDLTISTEVNTRVACPNDYYTINLPGVLKIEGLVDNQRITGTLTKTNITTGSMPLQSFEGKETIKTYLGTVETTDNYNIIIDNTTIYIERVYIDTSAFENLVYNGKVQVIIIGEYNSKDNPEKFIVTDTNGNSVSPINAGTYLLDYLDEKGDWNENIPFIIQKLNIYGEIDKTTKTYDGNSNLPSDAVISVVYYENNNTANAKQNLSNLGTGENVSLSAKYYNSVTNLEQVVAGSAQIRFEVVSGDM
ncbi:MAG: hypothetical protein IKA31_05785, partial [Clostridia bacterium]|nr:hypothetical protein [Clostridia bacterium]